MLVMNDIVNPGVDALSPVMRSGPPLSSPRSRLATRSRRLPPPSYRETAALVLNTLNMIR